MTERISGPRLSMWRAAASAARQLSKVAQAMATGTASQRNSPGRITRSTLEAAEANSSRPRWSGYGPFTAF
jgi:hypothetical protein